MYRLVVCQFSQENKPFCANLAMNAKLAQEIAIIPLIGFIEGF